MSNRDLARRLRLQGHTYQEIADQLGLTKSRIGQILAPPRVVREMVAEAAGHACQRCGIRLRYGDVHGPSVCDDGRFSLSTLEYLCLSCHRQAHPDGSNL